MQLNSIFAIASMTKLLTTICALQFVERGVVGLDDDVASHIPVLANQPILVGFKDGGNPILERRRKDITLRHLLTHSAGTSYALAEPKLLQYLQHEGRKPMEGNTIDEIFNYPLMYQPGEGWSYGSGLSWAGKVIESLSGKLLEECIQGNIFKPLGLSRVTFSPDQVPSMAGQLCDLHHRDEATGSLVPIGPALPYFKSTDHLGGEGAFVDLTEFFKVMESLLRDDGKLLKSETATLMFEPQLPSDEAWAALNAAVESPEWQAMGDFSGPKEHAWAFGGILVAGDGHPFRKRGCLIWGGAPNQFWVWFLLSHLFLFSCCVQRRFQLTDTSQLIARLASVLFLEPPSCRQRMRALER